MAEQIAPSSLPRRSAIFPASLIAAFFILQLIKIAQHVMWRDEWRAWMIARDSDSLRQLWQNAQFDGHPLLWHAILFVLSRFTDDPLAMKLLHLIIATAAFALFVYFSPLTRRQQILLALSYYFFFEYATISRAYGLGVLLTALACMLFVRGRRALPALAIVLFLLSNASAHGLIIAGSFAILYLLARVGRMAPLEQTQPLTAREMLAGAIVVLGAMCALVAMFPGPDSEFVQGTWGELTAWRRIAFTFSTVWRGYLPIPAHARQFWSTNILDAFPITAATAGLVLLAASAILLLRRPPALILFVTGIAGLLLATAWKFAGFTRHHGQLFVLLLAACWIADRTPARDWLAARFHRFTQALDRQRGRFLTGVLIIQAGLGIHASFLDLTTPFSASREVARYLRETGADRLPIIAHIDMAGSSISGCLDRPLFYLRSRRWLTFYSQNPQLRLPLFTHRFLKDVDKVMNESGGDVIVILSTPIDLPPHFVLERTFQNSILLDERYELYRVRHPLDEAPPDPLPVLRERGG